MTRKVRPVSTLKESHQVEKHSTTGELHPLGYGESTTSRILSNEFIGKKPTVRKIPNFSGGFFTWTQTFNINREQGFIERFVVLSSGKRQSVIKKLWLKLLWDELSELEFFLFISMPEVLGNNKFNGFLRMKLEVPKKILRQRLLKIENLLGNTLSSRVHYQGIKNLKVEILTEKTSLAKTKKFSGYIKSLSQRGKSSGGSGIPEPIDEITFHDEEEIDWYDLLSVEGFTLLGKSVHLPDEAQLGRNG